MANLKLRNNVYGQTMAEFKEKGDKVHYWLERATAMLNRRSYFEEMWRQSIFNFVAFAVYGNQGGKRSFDPDTAPELQGYFNNKFSTYGFRFTDVRYPLEFAVVMRKLSSEIKNIPQPDWIVLGEDDQSPSILWKNVYNQIIDESGGEYEDFETWLGKNVFGTAARWSRMVSYDNTVKEPKINDNGEVTYEEKTHQVRKFKSTNIDLRHILLDEGCRNSDLSDCEDAIVFEYYTEDEGKKVFSDVDFEEKGIKTKQKNELFQDINDLNGGDTKNFYEVMNCYSKTRDEYTILINGIEVRTSPIPMKSFRGEKAIPVTLFIDHKIPGQPYGYGEPALVKAFREIKNKNRNLIYDVTKKAAKPTLAIDPQSTFNEETYFWGQDFVRVAPSDMAPIPVQANLDAPIKLDAITDQDIVITTGINILDTANPDKGETATKTVIRKESQVAIIDLGMNFNTIALKRLHRINANILQLNLKVPEKDTDGNAKEFREVVTEGKKIFRSQGYKEESFFEEDQQGVFSFKFKGEDVDYEFMPTLKMGNIAVSEQLEKNVKMEGLTLTAQLAPNALDQFGVAEYLKTLHNFPETIIMKQQKTEAPDTGGESEEDMVNRMIEQAGGIVPDEQKSINEFKNAKQDQAVVSQATRPAAVGVGGEAGGIPVAGPV